MQLNFLTSQTLMLPSMSRLAIYVVSLMAMTPIKGEECPETLWMRWSTYGFQTKKSCSKPAENKRMSSSWNANEVMPLRCSLKTRFFY